MSAELVELARRAGMIAPEDAPILADPALPTAEAQLAALRKTKPHLWPKHASTMTPTEWQAARAEAVKRRPAAVPEIAGGRDVRGLSDRDWHAAKAAAGLRTPSLMPGRG